MSGQTVNVRREWNDNRIATYRIADLRGLHWSQVSGGLNTRSPREFLCGYVLCDEMLAGELSHSCRHGRPPHEIKVCVTRKDNPDAVYASLLLRMDWEYLLRACPYLVESRSETPPSPEQAGEMDRWLDEHWRRDGYVTIGFGRDDEISRTTRRPQAWFSNLEIAKAFATTFGLRSKGHQNQEKRHRAALELAMASDRSSPLAPTNR